MKTNECSYSKRKKGDRWDRYLFVSGVDVKKIPAPFFPARQGQEQEIFQLPKRIFLGKIAAGAGRLQETS
jgi:hypothetical protein